MPSIFSTFNMLRRTLSTQQSAINTTTHNISNANTEGYSRQSVTMRTTRPEGFAALNSTAGPGLLGTGVEVGEISRARDLFLDNQIRTETSTLGKYNSRDLYLSEVETIFMEPSDNGLSSVLGKMWDSWQVLSGNPENSTARTGVVQASKTLTDQINHTYVQLKDLQDNIGDLIKDNTVEVNYTVKQIEDLNRQIMGVKVSGNNPNDLLDKQDLLIDKLSGMLNIRVERTSLGEAVITTTDGKTNDTIYITGTSKQNLLYVKDVSDDGNTLTYYDKDGIQRTISKDAQEPDGKFLGLKGAKVMWASDSGGIFTVAAASVKGGSVEGYTTVYDEIETYKDQLDALAVSIAYAVNTVHNDGALPGEYGYVAFFTTKDGRGEEYISAANITVNGAFDSDLSLIKTNGIKQRTVNGDGSVTSVEYPATNGDRALAIARLRDSRIYINEFFDDGSSETGFDRMNNTIVKIYNDLKKTGDASMKLDDENKGTTIDGYFNDIVARLGSSTNQAKNMVTSQQALLDQLLTRKESISGVSMDEEMANLVQYQRTYQAAARALSMMDELLDTVVNGLIR